MDLKDDDYNSASDNDYNPDAPRESEGDSSSDEEAASRIPNGHKRKVDVDDLDFENSGDEATLKTAHRKRQKHRPAKVDEEDEGGEGGLIKTRAQRRAEVKEKKPLIESTKPSVDIDSLWTEMSKGKQRRPDDSRLAQSNEPKPQPSSDAQLGSIVQAQRGEPSSTSSLPQTQTTVGTIGQTKSESPSHANGEATVTIKRSYEFAGQKIEEERVVPASSAEARVYLEAQARERERAADTARQQQSNVRRPMKRKSMFGVGGSASAESAKAPKLNTLEKSKLDWAEHVDKEGITDELDEHRKAKGTYLGRMDFLGRMDAKREEDLRNARAK